MVTENKNFKCVIFDCDGVLINSEPLCCQALVNVFSSYDASVTYEDFEKHFQGGKIADILSETRDRLRLNVRLDDLEPMYREQTQVLFQASLKASKGVEALLDQLDEKDIQYCVVSNSPKNRIEFYLDLSGLTEKFKGNVFSAFDANSWKPEPDLLLYAAMNMGFSVDECIYIDDTVKGVEAGIRSGIKTVHLRANSYRPKYLDAETIEINSISQLISVLKD